MSSLVLGWVFKNSPARGPDRMLHVALGDSARDDGYLSGDEYGSMSHMQRKCNFPSRQTLTEAFEWLEGNGEILVLRRADRGWGKHNEIIVVMGRDRAGLLQEYGWPTKLLQSAPQTDVIDDELSATSAAPHTDDPMDPATAQEDAHRGVQAAPSAPGRTVGTDPVDSPPRRSRNRSARQTGGKWTGPGPVQDRSVLQRGSSTSPSSQQPSTAEVAHGPERGCDPRPVDEADSSMVQQLRTAIERRLAALAPPVTAATALWDLTPAQLLELAVHAAAWPTIDGAVDAFAAATAEAVQHYGVVPRSARAWRTTWLETRPPEPMPGEPLCTEHAIPGYDMPVRICAECRQRDVTRAIAQ